MTKASDLFIKALEEEGVEYIFGIPGEENLDFLDSLSRSKKIRLILTRHEQAAGFMAATYGRFTGKTGVCLSTLGPGATNFVTSAAYAQLGGMPMMMITGQKPVKHSKQGRFQIIDVVAMMEPITKYTHQLVSGDTIPCHVREAFRLAQEEKPGAVHLVGQIARADHDRRAGEHVGERDESGLEVAEAELVLEILERDRQAGARDEVRDRNAAEHEDRDASGRSPRGQLGLAVVPVGAVAVPAVLQPEHALAVCHEGGGEHAERADERGVLGEAAACIPVAERRQETARHEHSANESAGHRCDPGDVGERQQTEAAEQPEASRGHRLELVGEEHTGHTGKCR